MITEQEYRRGHTGSYRMTMTQIADLTSSARTNVHQARRYGRLIAHRTQLVTGWSDAPTPTGST